MTKNILISGASVAGPALAFWLRRYGFNPTVVERAPAPREGGYAVDFRGAALEALARMGILDEVKQYATQMGDMDYVNSAGKRVGSTPPVVFSGELEVLRGDLVKVLYERTRHDVEYIFNDSITSITQSGHGAAVTFERGAPREFDLVIGADGVHSNVRSLVFGAEEKFAHHLGMYVSVSTVANYLGLEYRGRCHNTPGRMAGMYPARGNTEAKALMFFTADELDYGRRDTARQRELLNTAFAGEGWEVPRILDEIRRSPDFYFDSITQIKMEHFTHGRVALLGDAGYCASPLSGMGTSLALVGAYVLAGELASAVDHQTAFARYEDEMRGYIKACHAQAAGAGMWLVPGSNAMIRFRNWNYRLLRLKPFSGFFTKVALKAANTIRLKDYAAFTRAA
ncbi:FAD-dependent monooxygenase [Actinocrispum wychmicini]|uniref:2-polyprenyl-6-methoxyphenol hydroxylase-like FAD-dependent oxidoreductase n=1 Tax=Actinocrispum wychmicini TaxID=1213861 RepID=A0A4R2KEW8_9PSEU|nr:FAD-dependent monooxygenase [Actinocrispum wychmicini]TCO65095.1 2-polyprenyl-6-methoxyphenol hydroxylase-like FAD-dependent oxidoreductase [Actinocrispum wychmicini]